MSGRTLGSKHTPEAIKKISQANAERWRDPAYRSRHLERLLAMQARGAQARKSLAPKRRLSTRARPFASIAERLEMYSIPEPNSGCLLWLGGTSSDGYGKMDLREHGVHRVAGVHRLALEQKLGRALLPGEQACHKCDVKLCVAEDHLFPGSNIDNVRDMFSKGRQHKGPRTKNKLSREQIAAIPHELGSDAVVASRYGVSRQRVQSIRSAARSAA